MLSYSVTVIVPVYNGEDYVKDCFYGKRTIII